MSQYVDFADFQKLLDSRRKVVVTTEYNRSNWEVPYVSTVVLGRIPKGNVKKLRPNVYEVRA